MSRSFIVKQYVAMGKNPIRNAANFVLIMYERRQELATTKCDAHSKSEIECAVDQLNKLATVADYLGIEDASELRNVADSWSRSGEMPELFNIDSED